VMQTGRLSNPEAAFELKHDPRFEEGSVGVALDQKFPLTARLRLERALSEKAVSAAELEVRDAERGRIAEAQTLAVKLLSLDQQRALRQKQSALAGELADFITKRADKGEMSALDASQAQLDTQRIMQQARQLETERIALVGQLKPLLGLSASDSLSVSGTLPVPAKHTGRPGIERRSDYQLSKLREESAQTEIELARARKWEDMRAGLFLEGERMEDAPEGLTRTGFFGLRFSLPLPLWNKNEGEIQEKSAGAQRAVLETKALASAIENETAAARSEMDAHARLAADTKDKLLPLVVQQSEKLQKAYEQGQADLLTVLRVREQNLSLETSILDSLRDYHLARIRYEAATGRHAPAESTTQPRSGK
jgi:outer membrane protein, heavy metal efflux system